MLIKMYLFFVRLPKVFRNASGLQVLELVSGQAAKRQDVEELGEELIVFGPQFSIVITSSVKIIDRELVDRYFRRWRLIVKLERQCWLEVQADPHQKCRHDAQRDVSATIGKKK